MKKVKKKINSKRKGSKAELELAKLLTGRFGMPFARVGVTSGARPKQVKLDEQAAKTFTGDIITPKEFKFSIECKAVNINVDLLEPSALLEKFLAQAKHDAESIGKQPMLCWKRNRKGWIAAVRVDAFEHCKYPEYFAGYRLWVVCRLERLLGIQDEHFWFDILTNERGKQ